MGAPGGGAVTVRFIVDPSELKELGLDPATVLGNTSQKPGESSSTQANPQDSGGEEGGGGKGGGMSAAMVGVMAGGIIGLLSFFKDLLSQSKLLNTYAQGMGKMFSAAIDILLMPFLPVLNMMLAGMSKLLAWLIDSGYLENMSRIVDQYIVPLLGNIGDGMAKLWGDMNHSLNPMNWDWAALGKTAVAMLELNAAFLLAGIEQLLNKIPGINIDVYGEETGPKAMAEQALALYGNKQQLSKEDFQAMENLYFGGMGVGAVAGTAIPLPGAGTASGAAIGAGATSLGLLNYKPGDASRPMDAGGGFSLDPTTGLTVRNDILSKAQGNTTINVTQNIHAQEDAEKEQQRLKALTERDRAATSQVWGQPGN